MRPGMDGGQGLEGDPIPQGDDREPGDNLAVLAVARQPRLDDDVKTLRIHRLGRRPQFLQGPPPMGFDRGALVVPLARDDLHSLGHAGHKMPLLLI